MKATCTFLAFALLVCLTRAAPLTEDPKSLSPTPDSAEDGSTLDPGPIFVEDVVAPSDDDKAETTSDIVEVSSSSTTTSTTSSTTEKPETSSGADFVDLDNIHLSPKLSILYKRLSGLNPDTLGSGVTKFREILLGSKSRDDFLNTLWKDRAEDAIGSADTPEAIEEAKAANARELEQFKSDLNELANFIAEKHPKVLSWFLTTVGGGRPVSTSAKLSFLEKFSEIDEEMSAYAVWNRYWTYWFTSSGDFIAKHG